MRNATELIVEYAASHRDRRNIATHFVGVPLIVFGLAVLAARPVVMVGELSLTPACLLWALSTLWYLWRGHLALGLAVSGANALLVALAQPVGGGATGAWLSIGFGSLLAGWFVQFLGHHYEGRQPALFDDAASLMVGPVFVAAEAMFALGWGKPLLAEIERRVGPTVLRDLHHPAAR